MKDCKYFLSLHMPFGHITYCRLTFTFILIFLPDHLFAETRYSVSSAVSDDASKTPLIILRDEQTKIEAAISPEKGGELSGLKVWYRGRWIETLYLARDYSPRTDWTGKAPFLWPATGRNFPPDLESKRKAGKVFNDGAYLIDGKRYEIPIHGFARNFNWHHEKKIATKDRTLATLAFQDTPKTRKYYPFGFLIEVVYTLEEGMLTIDYQILAKKSNSNTMPFSVGNHITFNCPLIEGTDPSKMDFISPSKTEILKTAYGLPTGEKRSRNHEKGIQLGNFEKRSAISLTGYQADPKIIYRDPQGLEIHMSHSASQIPDQPVVLFNIWGDTQAGFFSPEPWVGLQNSLVLNKGLIRLPPGKEFNWKIRIEFKQN